MVDPRDRRDEQGGDPDDRRRRELVACRVRDASPGQTDEEHDRDEEDPQQRFRPSGPHEPPMHGLVAHEARVSDPFVPEDDVGPELT